MATVARSKQDVDNMTSEQRIWDSLNNSYGAMREASDASYDRAVSQADRQALGRGMQRSSYNNQVIGNLLNQKTKAQNDIYSEQIGEYEKWLQNKEEQEAARAFQTSEREAQQAWQTSEREAQQKYNTGEREAQQAYNTSERIAQQIYNTGEREAQQKYNTGEREAQQAWQSGENALNRQQSQSQFDIQMAFNRDQAAQEQANWEKQFGFNEKTTDQQIAMTYAMNILQNGGNPSDELLARAGLTRADADAMKAQVSSGSGKGGTGNGDEETPGTTGNVTDSGLISQLNNAFNMITPISNTVNAAYSLMDKVSAVEKEKNKKKSNANNPIALIE